MAIATPRARARSLPGSVEDLRARKQAEAAEKEDHNHQAEPTIEEFLKEVFVDGTAQAQQGLPSLEELKRLFHTKSAAIRYLHFELGHPVNAIAKHLGVRYQQVRNIITRPLKRGPNESYHVHTNLQPTPSDDEEEDDDTEE